MKREFIYNIFSNMPTIECERTILRRMYISDAEDMYDYAKRREVSEYLTWNAHRDIHFTEDYLRYLDGRYRVGDFYDWCMVSKDDYRMIGTVGFTSFDFNSDVGEIGYVLNPDYRGRGLVPEAAKEILKFGFERLGLHRIEMKYIVGNTASERVAQKIGMKFEGIRREAMLIKGQYRDIGFYSILRDEYYSEYKK